MAVAYAADLVSLKAAACSSVGLGFTPVRVGGGQWVCLGLVGLLFAVKLKGRFAAWASTCVQRRDLRWRLDACSAFAEWSSVLVLRAQCRNQSSAHPASTARRASVQTNRRVKAIQRRTSSRRCARVIFVLRVCYYVWWLNAPLCKTTPVLPHGLTRAFGYFEVGRAAA